MRHLVAHNTTIAGRKRSYALECSTDLRATKAILLELGSVSLWLVAIVMAAISIGALIKGITGVGLPLVAVPAIASFTSVEEAVVLMIIPTFGSNLWLVANHRRFFTTLRQHFSFLAAGFIGGILGTFLLIAIDDRWLKLPERV